MHTTIVLFDRIVRALEDKLSSTSSFMASAASSISLVVIGGTLMLGSTQAAARSLPPSPCTGSFVRALVPAAMPMSYDKAFWTRLVLCGAAYGMGAILLASGVVQHVRLELESAPGIRTSANALVPGMIVCLQLATNGRSGGQDGPDIDGPSIDDRHESKTTIVALTRRPANDDSVGAEQLLTPSSSEGNNYTNDPEVRYPVSVEPDVIGLTISELDSQNTSNDVTVCSTLASSSTNEIVDGDGGGNGNGNGHGNGNGNGNETLAVGSNDYESLIERIALNCITTLNSEHAVKPQ